MVDRLFRIVYLLMEKKCITAKELANRLEVSERTIYRDLDKLSLAGIPVYTNRGNGGGITLLSDYVLDKATLTDEDKRKIVSSLQAMNAVTNEQDIKELERLQDFLGWDEPDWIEIDFSTWGNAENQAEIFQQLKTAILQHFYVEISYASGNEITSGRRIKPLKLLFKDQAWYLYAFCEMRQDYRYFKLPRIIEYRVTEDTFESVPVGRLCTDDYQKSIAQAQRIKLQIDEKMAFRAYEELPNVQQLENGDLICEVDVHDVEGFIGYVLTFGEYARILSPESVVETVKQRIKNLQKIYK